jgi:polysaccharide pyruvyl transferase WcaK-like protein
MQKREGPGKEVRRPCPRVALLTPYEESATRRTVVTDVTENEDKRTNSKPSPSEQTRDCSVALLTPYGGANLGDAAIQDAVIANLQARLGDVSIAGISLSSENFLERHGARAFPLCVSSLPFYGMYNPWKPEPVADKGKLVVAAKSMRSKNALKRVLGRIPGARRIGKRLQAYLATIAREIRHAVDGYRFLKSQQLLIVSGGGQLDEEWGGPWGHPYCLLKWAAIAKFAGVPFAFASVGAGKTSSPLSRLFLSTALRLARYRSYRDGNSRMIAAKCLARARKDPVVPDLAFSLPPAILPAPVGLRPLAQGRPIFALSPIAYAKAGQWPTPNQALHERYMQRLVRVASELLMRGYFLVLTWSSVGDDDIVVSELYERLSHESGLSLGGQVHRPTITSWRELAAVLEDVDFLIASRLHSTILGFVTNTPTIAISFDPKVNWVMQDLGLTDYLLEINKFEAEDVLQAVDRLVGGREQIVGKITAYRERISSLFSSQNEALGSLATAGRKC